MLAKNPGFASIAILSIAVGVGANAAMFSVADGLVLRPLPVPSPSRVLTVLATSTGQAFRSGNLSYPEYLDVRDRSRSFDGLVAYTFVTTSFAHRPDEPAQRKVGTAVSGNLFDTMGVTPARGRGFRPDEDTVGGRHPVVVLDYEEWTQAFGADPGIIDSRIRINGVEFTVIGVAADGFTGIDHDVRPAFYVPMAMWTTVQAGLRADELARRDAGARSLVVKGRLKRGVSIEQARADLAQVGTNMARAYADTNRGRSFTARTQLDAFLSRPGAADGPIVFMLLTLAVAVLAIACANVGGLLVSRAPARARDMAMRLAVGAKRGRLVAQLITEGGLLGAGGAAVGLALAYGAIRAFQRLEFPTDFPLKLTFALDIRAFTVGLAAALASAVLASLVPAWLASRTDLATVFKVGETPTVRRRFWGRHLMVGGQIAVAMVLFTMSVLLYRGFAFELTQGPGFRTDHIVMMAFDPRLARYDEAATRQFYRQLTERTQALPGVVSASLSSTVPMKSDTMEMALIAPEGIQFAPGTTSIPTMWGRVDETYFDVLGIRVLRGRPFMATDIEGAPPVAIINEALARQYWPGLDPLGKRIRLERPDGIDVEIVGVAADSRNVFIGTDPAAFLYVPRDQQTSPRSTLLVHTTGPSLAMAGVLRDVVRDLDPNMPIFGVRTMEDFYYSRATYVARLVAGSVGAMGAMAVGLAVVGLYGLVSYATSRRTREFGIRMAIGAQPRAVLRMVLRHGLVLAGSGIGVGLVGSVAVNGVLPGTFSGLSRVERGVDLWTYALVVPVVVAVTLLATYVPARRAARVNPLVALRAE
jgi:predicted permease